MEGEEELPSFREKALFYTTAFFVLLGTFSLFAFLFLVPFVIDPAFTTIFMQVITLRLTTERAIARAPIDKQPALGPPNKITLHINSLFIACGEQCLGL
jgi:Na+ channel auxiliary subunit TipE